MLITIADNLPRLMNCNGSRLMKPAFPQTDQPNPIRDEGNAAHYMAQAVFKGEFLLEEIIDRKAPNGAYMSAVMADHVAEYLSSLDCGEMEVDTSFGTDLWRVNGRADHIGFNASTNVLTVDDLKYGYSLVSPEMNWTLIWHAIGYCITRQIAPAQIIFRIHQPRQYHPDGKVRSWSVDYAGLMQLYAQINTTLSNPSDTLITGNSVGRDWCRRCYALATCPAARAASMNAVDVVERAFSDDMPNDEMAYELTLYETAESTITNRYKAMKELATYRMTQGALIDGYALEDQFTNTRWKSGLDANVLSMMTGKDLRTAPDTVTPAEAKRRGVPEHVVKSLTERVKTGKKLVRMTANDRAKRLLKKDT